MVKGIDKFKEYFADFAESYVVIGGTACDIHETQSAQIPRATKDIDIILIIEALSDEFVERFWQLIRDGKYDSRNIGSNDNQHEYYRFKKPEDRSFPYQLELFSRRLGAIHIPDDAHLTPIPTGEDLSSLSAILMDNQYYNFTLQHSTNVDGVHIANLEALICLKAKAYLEMVERKEKEGVGDAKDIRKHKNDVYRLATMLATTERIQLPSNLHDHLLTFLETTANDLPNNDFFKAAGVPGVTGEMAAQQIRDSFVL
jgi:Domain of unknown function (DUF1814).